MGNSTIDTALKIINKLLLEGVIWTPDRQHKIDVLFELIEAERHPPMLVKYEAPDGQPQEQVRAKVKPLRKLARKPQRAERKT